MFFLVHGRNLNGLFRTQVSGNLLLKLVLFSPAIKNRDPRKNPIRSPYLGYVPKNSSQRSVILKRPEKYSAALGAVASWKLNLWCWLLRVCHEKKWAYSFVKSRYISIIVHILFLPTGVLELHGFHLHGFHLHAFYLHAFHLHGF